jgi:rhamnose transport system permease protein
MKALRRFEHWHEVVLVVLLGALLAYAAKTEPRFLSVTAQVDLSTHAWELALLSLPMLLIIVTGGIDLSVGSALALCAVVLGLTFERWGSLPAACAAAVVTGVAIGALNGFFVAKIKVHPLIVTLATLAAFRGVAQGISLGRPIGGFPGGFQDLATTPHFGLPLPGWAFVLGLIVTGAVLAKTPLGRSVYTIGHNETAAVFSGLRVDRIKLLLYTLAGGVAGIGAVCMVGRHMTAKADLANGLELEVITTVVLGGASINGGRGNVFGLLLGLALIHETREFVGWHWSKSELNPIVIGGLLIMSVLLHRLLAPRSRGEE